MEDAHNSTASSFSCPLHTSSATRLHSSRHMPIEDRAPLHAGVVSFLPAPAVVSSTEPVVLPFNNATNKGSNSIACGESPHRRSLRCTTRASFDIARDEAVEDFISPSCSTWSRSMLSNAAPSHSAARAWTTEGQRFRFVHPLPEGADNSTTSSAVIQPLQHRPAMAQAPLLDLVSPFRFAMVEEGVYRGAYPTLRNFPFLQQLCLRTIVSLTPEKPTYDLTCFAEAQNIQLKHIQAERFKGELQLLPTDISNALGVLINAEEHPVYIHCLDGRHVVGAVIMALRKLQQWNVESSHLEYLRFTKGSHDEVSFIADYCGPLTIPWRTPPWLWGDAWLYTGCGLGDKTGSTTQGTNFIVGNKPRLQAIGIKLKFPASMPSMSASKDICSMHDHNSSSVRGGNHAGGNTGSVLQSTITKSPLGTEEPVRAVSFPFDVAEATMTAQGVYIDLDCIQPAQPDVLQRRQQSEPTPLLDSRKSLSRSAHPPGGAAKKYASVAAAGLEGNVALAATSDLMSIHSDRDDMCGNNKVVSSQRSGEDARHMFKSSAGASAAMPLLSLVEKASKVFTAARQKEQTQKQQKQRKEHQGQGSQEVVVPSSLADEAATKKRKRRFSR